MELYEALKSGTSSKELEEAFRKSLDEAVKRIEAEKAKTARADEVAAIRKTVAKDLYRYACTLLGVDEIKDAKVSVNSIEKKLIESEQDLIKFCKFTKQMDNILDKFKSQRSDDDIINSFLKQLH